VVHNGSQRVHAASDLGVRVRTSAPAPAANGGYNGYNGGLASVATFASLDSALVRVGDASLEGLTPLPMPATPPPKLPATGAAGAGAGSVAFNLMNNAWGTNYVMWQRGDSLFRFTADF